MLDKDKLGEDVSAHIADVSSNKDAVNGHVSAIGFMTSLFRKHKSDPTAITTLADLFDERKTEIAQAGVANTMHEPKDKGDEPKRQDSGLRQPSQVEANSGNFGVRQPKADEPSYIPPSAGDAGGSVKDGKTLADKQAESKEIGETVEAKPKPVVAKD